MFLGWVRSGLGLSWGWVGVRQHIGGWIGWVGRPCSDTADRAAYAGVGLPYSERVFG